jgi:ABC-type multidrug transport system fused ATPase/permease subunit
MTRMETVRSASRVLAPHRRRLTVLGLVTLVGALLGGVGDPVSLKLLVDSMSAGDKGRFVVLALCLLVVYTGVRLFRWWGAVLTQELKNRVYEDVTSTTFRAYFRVPYARLTNDSGYYVSRICDEPLEIAKGVDLVVKLISNVVVLVGGLAVCLWLSWKVAIVLTTVVPLLLYLANQYGRKISSAANGEKEAQAELREGIGRSVASYKTVNMFGQHDTVHRAVDRRIGSYLSLLYARVKYVAAFQAASGVCLSYAEMAVLIGAGLQVIQGNMTIGGLFGFTSAYWRVVASFKLLVDMVPEAANLGNQVQRMEEFQAMAAPPQEASDHGSIVLNDAGFAYGENRVLDGFGLTVTPRDRIFVTGPNGSGKSTLTHILSGFLKVDGGEALLPPLERMSCLLLPFDFIPGTLRDSAGMERMTPEQQTRFMEIVQRFGLADKLDRDPASLSEGEKRKFQVALTLLKDADFYVLDEPLAHVDLPSKPVLMDAICERTRDKALVVIMHGEDEYRGRFDRQVVLGNAGFRVVGEPGEAPAPAAEGESAEREPLVAV